MPPQPTDHSGLKVDIRVLVDEQDLTGAFDVFRTAMVGLPSFGPLPPGTVGKIFEPGRTLGAYVAGQLVGTVDSAASSLTLPGGRTVAHAAVTHVGVLPTHTRRGIVSRLLQRQLGDARAGGEVVATLRASEATIYGRYGYGIASRAAAVEVDTRRGALRSDAPAGDRVRLVDPAGAWDVLPGIHARNADPRPGAITRPPVWWAAQEMRAATAQGPAYVALAGSEGSETGFVRYHPIGTEAWFGGTERTVVVDDLHAPSRDTFVGIVRFLWNLDLVDRIIFPTLPVDSSLPWLLTDPRGARTTGLRDETWLRILDVGTALGARAYAGGETLVIGVHDHLLPANTGTYRVSGGDVETVAHRIEPDVDLETDVATLSGALLGGVRWHQLAASGTVRARSAGAIASADRSFGTDLAAFAGTNF